MSNRLDVCKCEACGTIIEVLHAGDGGLVCCSKPMKVFTENTVDASKEKHTPVIEKTASGYKVTVGSVVHPMEDKHYIEWIELVAGDTVCRQFLKPGQAPVAEFRGVSATPVVAREFCNLHGLWKV